MLNAMPKKADKENVYKQKKRNILCPKSKTDFLRFISSPFAVLRMLVASLGRVDSGLYRNISFGYFWEWNSWKYLQRLPENVDVKSKQNFETLLRVDDDVQISKCRGFP